MVRRRTATHRVVSHNRHKIVSFLKCSKNLFFKLLQTTTEAPVQNRMSTKGDVNLLCRLLPTDGLLLWTRVCT